MKTVFSSPFRLTVLASLLCSAGLVHGQAVTGTPGSTSASAFSSTVVPRLGPVQAVESTGVPSWETTTTASEISRNQVRNWSDLGRLIPGLDFNRDNKSVNMRGLDGNRVRIVEDGIPVPWLNDGSRQVKGGLETVNFNMLSSVDVVRGAGAGAGNASSLTGAVVLRGLRPDDLLSDGKDIGFLVKGTHDGLDDSIGGDMAFAARLGAATKMLIQYGIRTGHEAENGGDIGGYGATRTKMNPADYTSKNVGLRLEHELAPGHTLGLGASTFRLDRDIDQMHDQNTKTYAIGNNERTERIKRDRAWVDYNYKSIQPYSALDQAGIQLYWAKTRLEENQNAIRKKDGRAYAIPGDPYLYGYPSGLYERTNSIEQKGWGANLSAGGYWGDAALRGHWIVAGTFADDTYEQYSAGIDNCPVVPPGLRAPMGPRTCDFLHSNQGDTPKVKSRDWSLSASHAFMWNNDEFILTPTVRYDGWSRKPQTGGGFASNQNGYESELRNRSASQVSPSLEFAWNASDIYSVTARYGYGYRAPTAPELFLQYGSPANYMRKGDPDLQAERSRGWELGFQARGQTVGGSLNLFETRYKNFIDKDVPVGPDSSFYDLMQQGLYPDGVTTFANRNRVRIYGAEAMGYWNINDNLYTRGTVAWTVGKDLETGQHLNSVAPLKGTLALGYKTEQWGAETVWTLASKRDKVQYPDVGGDVTYADFKAPGYGTLDVHGWWAPAGLKGVKFQLSVVNLFDKKYWNALNVPTAGVAATARPVDYYSEAGRYVRVSVSYQY